MHTDLSNATLTVAGRRELSAKAKFWHWTAIICTWGMWYPIYWFAKRGTRNVKY